MNTMLISLYREVSLLSDELNTLKGHIADTGKRLRHIHGQEFDNTIRWLTKALTQQDFLERKIKSIMKDINRLENHKE